MLDSSPKSELGCNEPDWEAKMARLVKEQKVVDEFLMLAIEFVDIYGSHNLSRGSFSDVIASSFIRQTTIKPEIERVSKKLDKK